MKSVPSVRQSASVMMPRIFIDRYALGEPRSRCSTDAGAQLGGTDRQRLRRHPGRVPNVIMIRLEHILPRQLERLVRQRARLLFQPKHADICLEIEEHDLPGTLRSIKEELKDGWATLELECVDESNQGFPEWLLG